MTYAYHRSGQLRSVTDAAGTRTFAYHESWTDGSYEAQLREKSGRLQSETLPSGYFGSTNNVVAYDYQFATSGRRNGEVSALQLGASSTYGVAYGYDDRLRLASLAFDTVTPFTYSYTPHSNLIAGVEQVTPSGSWDYARDYTFRSDSNRLERLDHAWGTVAARGVQTRLTYNAAGLRDTEMTQGTDWMAALGRSSIAGVGAEYAYTARREVDSSSKKDVANWNLGGARSGTSRDYNYDPIGNRTSDQGGSYTADPGNAYTAVPGAGLLTYDNNGNLIGDGTRTYAYDAENRLVYLAQGSSSWTFKYDYLGRRISKTQAGGVETRYLYDGWNLIAELNTSGAILRRFVWGLDVSGTLQGAGGVGGLLMILDGANRFFPIYDASHNIVGLYDQNGAIVAAYEYDPFGNVQTEAGVYADANPFRFSTKYTDTFTVSGVTIELVYYGLRYYAAWTGRFVNRDPIEEAGGLNLYAFCGNDGVNRWDLLGGASSGFFDWLYGSGVHFEPPPDESARIEDAAKGSDEGEQDVIPLAPFVVQGMTRDEFAAQEQARERELQQWGRGLQERSEAERTLDYYERQREYQSVVVAPNSGVGAPGTLESFIPIWGSGRAAVNDFQNGKWGWGTFNAVMAVSDVFLVKTAATMAGKGLWKAGSATWGATRKWLGKQGYAEAGQHVHHGIVAQEVYRGTAWEKIFNQPWNLKPLEPPPGTSMDAWHKMVEGKLPGLNGAERWWHGTPDWFRFTQISVTGDVVNAVGNDGDGKP